MVMASSAQLPTGSLTPHSARSSNRARQWQLIRAELPSNGYPQPSGSSKNARQWHFIRAERSSNGSSRSHRALEGSSLPSCFVYLILSSFVSPLLPLGLGLLLVRGYVRRLTYFYDVTDAGPASHRVRLWQGGPASTIPAGWRSIVRRHWYSYSSSSATGSSWTSQAPLASPEAEGRWQWRSLRPLALPSFVVRSAPVARRTPDAFPFWSLYSDGPLSSRPQPLVSVGDDTPCEDTREDFGLSV